MLCIAVTLWRLGISQRNLIQWASHAPDSPAVQPFGAAFLSGDVAQCGHRGRLTMMTYHFTPPLLAIALPVTILWCLAR
ncbi:Uncharacterised protein [Raoultella ornithinolytica]|nr:Uncharacterised protein [Raoultella ornithinolytica]